MPAITAFAWMAQHALGAAIAPAAAADPDPWRTALVGPTTKHWLMLEPHVYRVTR